jgi:hypothetical protein
MSNPDSSSKGYDDSPPRNGVIFFYTVLTVFVLVGVKLLLDSYFVKTMEGEVRDKVLTRGMEEVATLRAKEKETLERTGIASAMKTLAQRGRTASPLIVPQSGQGKASGPGWTQLPRAQAAAEAPSEAPPVQGTPEETTPSPGKQPTSPVQPGPGLDPNERKPASNVNPAGRSE